MATEIRSFRDLETWQSAMTLAVSASEIADRLPERERFVLAAQIRRSAISVPSNIAEGHAHHGTRIFLRHIRIALGSLAELDSQTELAVRFGFISAEHLAAFARDLARTGQLLHGLERSLKRRVLGQNFAGLAFFGAVGAVLLNAL